MPPVEDRLPNAIFKKIKLFTSVALSLAFISGCVGAPVLFAGAAGTGGANVAGSSITVPQQAQDIQIKLQIFTILRNLPGLNETNSNVEVTVFNGIVLLTGQIPTEDLKQELAARAAGLQNVKIIYNQLTVGSNVSFTRFANDGFITSKVKSNMIGTVNPLHFKVVTQEGIVYLLGEVTAEEGNLAAEIASETSGVKEVIKLFNYIAPTAATPAVVNSEDAQSTTATSAPATSSMVQPAPVSTPSNATNTEGIPQYAPNYAMPAEKVGPAASD